MRPKPTVFHSRPGKQGVSFPNGFHIMKSTIAVGVLLFSTLAVSDLLAQGQLIWGNNLPATPIDPQVRAPIYGVDPNNPTEIRRGNTASGLPAGTQTYAGPPLAGTGFTMAIYLGNDPASTIANNTPPATLGTSAFRTGTGAGLMFQLTAAEETLPLGTTVYYQFRAWDNQMGTVSSWAQVMARGGLLAAGRSDVYSYANILDGALTPPLTSDIRSFQLTQVPEPSLIALGALGLGALLFRRRNKPNSAVFPQV